MQEIQPDLKTQWNFLINEYIFLANYLKANYEERDRYVNFYTAIITAIAAGVGFAWDKGNWISIFIMVLISTIFSIFTLFKVLYQRIVVTEYKNYLNLMRGKLLEYAAFQYDIRPILLSTTASVKYLKTGGGDAVLNRIIEFFTGISTASATYLFISKILLITDVYFLYIPSVVIFLFVIIILEVKWKNKLRKKDERKANLTYV